MTASPISRMDTSVEDRCRESSREGRSGFATDLSAPSTPSDDVSITRGLIHISTVIHRRQKRQRDAVALLGSEESDGLASLREHGLESSAVRLARASRWVRISI